MVVLPSDYRLSAARSKERQKFSSEGSRTKLEMLAAQKAQMAGEMERLQWLCKDMEEQNAALKEGESLVALPAATQRKGRRRTKVSRHGDSNFSRLISLHVWCLPLNRPSHQSDTSLFPA